MTLDQNTFRIFHFDRHGVKYTPPIDIHNDAETFVRMILGLSSLDENVLGLNTAIKWTIDPETRRKIGGTVSITGDNGKEVTYDLVDPQPSTRCFTIRGRGLTSWRARTRITDPGVPPSEVVVRFTWRADDRVAEHKILTRAAGIRGIVQMITKHGKEESTKTLRGFKEDEEEDGMEDQPVRSRLGSCIILEAHGQSIGWYTSQRQFFVAIRDVIAGKCVPGWSDMFQRYLHHDKRYVSSLREQSSFTEQSAPTTFSWGLTVSPAS